MENEEMNTVQDTGEKTFTQDDVNRIVQDRLAKEKSRSAEALGEKEKELAARELRLNNRQKLISRGYPESLLDALNGSDAETFDKALDALDGYIKDKNIQNDSRFTAPTYTTPTTGKGISSGDKIRKAMGLK